jgi:ammonium transporter, Amt family
VTGILYGGYNQFWAQVIGIVANVFWVGITSYALFRVIDATIGMRVKPEAELRGLDNSELLAAAYVSEDAAEEQPLALPWTQGSN